MRKKILVNWLGCKEVIKMYILKFKQVLVDWVGQKS